MFKFSILSILMSLIIVKSVFSQISDSTQIPVPKNVKISTIQDTTQAQTEFQSTEQRDKSPNWFYSIGFDGMTSSGNVNRQLLNFRTTINFEKPNAIFGFFSAPKFQYGTNADLLQEREIFADLNSTLFYSKHNVYVLIFGAYEQSNLRKISSRYNAGVGIGWRILGGRTTLKSKVKLSISNAIVREVTDFETNQDKDVFRNSTRIKFRYDIVDNKLFIQNVTFLQPSLSDNYFRWNSSSQLSYKVGKHLTILASFENTYENFIVVGTQSSQTNTTFGLVYSGSN